jgi:hypothetical protein
MGVRVILLAAILTVRLMILFALALALGLIMVAGFMAAMAVGVFWSAAYPRF